MQVHVDADACGPVAGEAEDLPLGRGALGIEPGAHQHLLGVEGPALDEHAVLVLAADLVAQVVRDRELQEVPGDPLVAEDGARVFDRRPYVEVAALRVVGRDEVEAARIVVVEPAARS